MDHPVVQIAYDDAVAYAKWAGKRLPTEAEWEFGARGGLSGAAYPWGDEFRPAGRWMANTWQGRFPGENTAADGFAGVAPVRRFPANAYGLHDMSGNVWEWCADWYDPKGYANDKQTDPSGPVAGNDRVQRGGGWSSDAKRCRSASRIGRDAAGYRGCYLGFRVVLDQSRAETIRDAGAR